MALTGLGRLAGRKLVAEEERLEAEEALEVAGADNEEPEVAL